MLFLAQQLLPPDLNTIVDQIGQSLPVHKLKRDLPSRNRTRDAYDVLRALPESVCKRLGEQWRRAPYTCHAATALADSPAYEELLGDQWRTGNCYFSPVLTREQKKQAVEEYGPQEVKQWRDWLAAEFRARYYCYGTRGLFLRRFFLNECTRYRKVLGSDHQAPLHWANITSLMIRSGALTAMYYHRSGGRDFPSFTFAGGGARPEWR